jgi:hypothetical protein
MDDVLSGDPLRLSRTFEDLTASMTLEQLPPVFGFDQRRIVQAAARALTGQRGID